MHEIREVIVYLRTNSCERKKYSSGCERLLMLLFLGMETVFELLPNKKKRAGRHVCFHRHYM